MDENENKMKIAENQRWLSDVFDKSSKNLYVFEGVGLRITLQLDRAYTLSEVVCQFICLDVYRYLKPKQLGQFGWPVIFYKIRSKPGIKH